MALARCFKGSAKSADRPESQRSTSESLRVNGRAYPLGRHGDDAERDADALAKRALARGSGQGAEASRLQSSESTIPRASGPLDPRTRQDMEDRFGHDFSRVRVHTDRSAEHSTRGANAIALTLANDIYFGHGAYAPSTTDGRALLAHELAHVVQAENRSEPPVARRQPRPNLVLDDAPEFPGCSPYHRFLLDQQRARAQGMTEVARRDIREEVDRRDRGSGTISIAGSRISKYFKTDQGRPIRTLLSKLDRIQNILARGPDNWACVTETGCAGECRTVAACAAPKQVQLCPKFFQNHTDIEQSVMMIHEAAHQAGLGLLSRDNPLVASEIYRSDPRFAGIRTAKALDNPDSYATLVAELAYGTDLPQGRVRWGPTDMMITGTLVSPALPANVGRFGAPVGHPQNEFKAGAKAIVTHNFTGRFVFNAAFDRDTPQRPSILRPPEIHLKITLVRSSASPGNPKNSILMDRRDVATPNVDGILVTSKGESAYSFDLAIGAQDAGIIEILAEILDPDTRTNLVYRDRLLVRPASP